MSDAMAFGRTTTPEPRRVDVLSDQKTWLAGLSDQDRRALMRGEGFPSRRGSVRRLVRGVSSEADGIFTLLGRTEDGARTVRSLTSSFGGYVAAATDELIKLGLVERVGHGEKLTVRLTGAAEGTMLMSSWSMRN